MKITLKNLKDLACAVEAQDDETIDLKTWYCGSCFCALGLAAKLGIGGLKLYRESASSEYQYVVGVLGEEGFSAAAAAFSLTKVVTEKLFGLRDVVAQPDNDLPTIASDRQVWLSRYRELTGDRS